jgi:hypothetical protein
MHLIQAHARGGKLIHHRCLVTLAAVRGDAFVAEIINEDKHNIGLGLGSMNGGGEYPGDQEGKNGFHEVEKRGLVRQMRILRAYEGLQCRPPGDREGESPVAAVTPPSPV